MNQEVSNLFTRLAPVLNVRDPAAERAFYESLGLLALPVDATPFRRKVNR